MNAKLLARMPPGLARVLTRRAFPIAVVILLLSVSTLGAIAFANPAGVPFSSSEVRHSPHTDVPLLMQEGLFDMVDSDNDGLPDVLENFIYGTDPENWDSAGMGVPDGWLVAFGYDPLSPATRTARVDAPPAGEIPEAYGGEWPDRFHMSLFDFYKLAAPEAYTPGVDAAWWLSGGPHPDPSEWRSESGIPASWLVYHGLDPFDPDLGDAIPEGSESRLTVREAFTHNTNPWVADTEGDGLDDHDEIHVHGTDPSKFSTSGSGIPDGWLVHHGLDPLNRALAFEDTSNDGLTNIETFLYSYNRFEDEVKENGIRTIFERGLDPLEWSTGGSGIPDGWLVVHGLDPFDPAIADTVLQRASDWGNARWLDEEEIPEGEDPLPDLEMTVWDAYAYGRPSDWNEAFDGPWWGGTDPNALDTDGDGLPDAVEIRGWYVNVTYDLGPNAQVMWLHVTADPTKADSSGDGLTDAEEYFGRADCGDDVRVFPPTDPRAKDTAFSGLTDREKVCGALIDGEVYDFGGDGEAGMDPTRADNAGDYMRDGARLRYWHERYLRYLEDPTYEFPYSRYNTIFDWTSEHDRFSGLEEREVIRLFRPDGDIDGNGVPNALDADPAGMLLNPENADAVFLQQGPQIDPSLYRFTEYRSEFPRPVTDPANPDTDGDRLPDWWETRYAAWDVQAGEGDWNLNASRWSSYRDDVPDADRNLDGDVVHWPAYAGTGEDRTRIATGLDDQPFAYTNWQEYRFDTNPNVVSTDDDGISDGWKAFWGVIYPDLVANGRAGDLTEEETARIQDGRGLIQPGTNLEDQGNPEKVITYYRFIRDVPCEGTEAFLEDRQLLQPGERVDHTDYECAFTPLPTEDDEDPAEITVARVAGTYRLTYAEEYALAVADPAHPTNPYLVDTDGDGAPDAWEVLHMAPGPEGGVVPDPAAPDWGDRADPYDHGIPIAHADPFTPTQWNPRPQEGAPDVFVFDPHKRDTNFNGISDEVEIIANLDPLNPGKIVDDLKGDNRDSDGDGLPDWLELTGWGRETYGVPVRTDPRNPDTAGSGLLDRGFHDSGQPVELDPSDASDAERLEAWRARGLAHCERHPDCPNADGVRFFGEAIPQTDPNAIWTLKGHVDCPPLPQTAGSAACIPDGWKGYYYQLGLGGTPTDADAYVWADYARGRWTASDAPAEWNRNPAGRPVWWTQGEHDWWDERVHGVWWWGNAPGADYRKDLTNDGLHDRNGEDPFPALAGNVYVHGDVRFTNPADARDYVLSAPTAEEARARAQAFGDTAGHPLLGRLDASREQRVRAATELIDLTVTVDGTTVPFDDAERLAVQKGRDIVIDGRLVVDERTADGFVNGETAGERLGVPNATVLVSAFGRHAETAFGVAFTNATGHFTLVGNLTNTHRVDVPDGLVAMGSVGGTASWRVNGDAVQVGDATRGVSNSLVVWSYNTSAPAVEGTPYADYDFMTASGRRASAIGGTESVKLPVRVYSDTRLTFDLEPVALNGDRIRGTLTLTDETGDPLDRRNVTLVWNGAGGEPFVIGEPPMRVVTDDEGVVNLTALDIPVALPGGGARILEARFHPGDNDRFLRLGRTTVTVPVKDPTVLTVDVEEVDLADGGSAIVTGRLTTDAYTLADGTSVAREPVPGATLRIQLGGATQETVTDADGRFTARVHFPADLSAGANLVRVSFAGTDRFASAGPVGDTVLVKRATRLVDLSAGSTARGTNVTVSGTLVDVNGRAVEDRAVDVVLAGGNAGSAVTDGDGRFRLRVAVPALLPLGNHEVVVRFPGDEDYGEAVNRTRLGVYTSTAFHVDADGLGAVRGEDFVLTGTMRDRQGEAVPRQPVHFLWDGVQVRTVVTDDAGRFTITYPVSPDHRLGSVGVGLQYAPAATDVYEQGSPWGATVPVRSAVTLELADKDVRRGTVLVTGRLLDDRGNALTGQPVEVRWDGETVGTPRVLRNGTFMIPYPMPAGQTAGPVTVEAVFAPDAGVVYAPARATATYAVHAASVLRMEDATAAVRGDAFIVNGTLRQDNGAPIAGRVNVTLGGRLLGEADVRDGRFEFRGTIPEDMPRGRHAFALAYEGTDFVEPARVDTETFVKVRPQVEVDLPRLAMRGLAVSGEVILRDDQGQPLRNQTFVYATAGHPQPVRERTDAEGRAVLAGVAQSGGTAFMITVPGGDDVMPSQFETASVAVVGPAAPVAFGLLALMAVLGIAAVGFAVWYARWRRKQLTEVREILDETIEDLLAGNEYVGTIFLAYRRLSAHLASHGFVEKDVETAREFTAGVRKAVPVGARSLRILIGFFEEAKYSDHRVGAGERDRAIESLQRVREDIDVLLGKPGAQNPSEVTT